MSATEIDLSGVLEARDYGPLIALALDPGGTTGYALAMQVGNNLKLHIGQDQWSLLHMFEILHSCMIDDPPVHVIYETFEFRQFSRTGLDLTPVKLIGVIELVRDQFEPFVHFYPQTAATGKAFWSDDKLKDLGVWVPGRKHGMDATRHLMQWVKFGQGGQWLDLDKLEIQMIEGWFLK